MRIVITGGSGLIGTALADHFLEKGQEVIILSRNPEYKKRSPAGAKLVEWDGREPGAWAQWVDGAEAVINLAGAGIAGDSPLRMRWTAKRKNTILESRVKAGEAVSAAIRSAKVKPKVLIQSSAVGIYGPRGDEIIDEGFPHGDDFLAEVCKQWETSTAPVEEMGVRRVVMRTGLVFAGRGGIFPLLKLPFSLFAGGPLGHGRQYLSWVHIEDIVQAVQHFIGNEHTQGVYN
ncbi:MAG: TIGR01777 family oxidoreductase, partial [Anaerolineae bacterium]|nr:TIGR01777 family oxidoreductase [Anaerolineae bacterium]